MIMSGITIGHGAIIAAGSIVTKNINNYSIVAGAPAKEIKRRFIDELCNRLLHTEWWTLEPYILKVAFTESIDESIKTYQ